MHNNLIKIQLISMSNKIIIKPQKMFMMAVTFLYDHVVIIQIHKVKGLIRVVQWINLCGLYRFNLIQKGCYTKSSLTLSFS